MSLLVEFYTRRGCCLCDRVREVLEQVRREIPFEFREVHVEDSPDLEARYGTRIPLVVINGRSAFKFRLTAEALRRRLRRENAAPAA